MNEQEILRIGNEAAAEEAQQPGAGPAPGATADIVGPGVVEEFAAVLDMLAKVIGYGTGLPTLAQRFNHEANCDIAAAAVKLCGRYGIDARAYLIGEDSPLGAWLGLGLAVALPGAAVYQDYKLARVKEVKQEGGEGGAANGQQPGE